MCPPSHTQSDDTAPTGAAPVRDETEVVATISISAPVAGISLEDMVEYLTPPLRVGMMLPTLLIVGQGNPIGRWLGACDLVGPDTRIPQAEIIDFLAGELRKHQDEPVCQIV